MFERYTDDARKVIFLARYEASRLGSPALEPEHLWLGLLRHNSKLVKRLAPHVSPESIHRSLQQRTALGQRVSMAADLPLSEPTQRVLGTVSGAGDPSLSPIRTQDLLLALLRENSGTI